MLSRGFLFLAVLILGAFALIPQEASATPAGDNIIISEVEYDSIQGGADASYEWIELFNPTLSPIDVSGWELKEGSSPIHTFAAATTIGSGQYFLLVNNTTNFNINYPAVTPDVEMAPDLSLNNTGDELTLWDGIVGASTIVDYIAWEGFAAGWGTPNAPPGQSVCRGTSTDTDTQADLITCVVPTPGSGSLGLSAVAPGGVVSDLALWVKANEGVTGSSPITAWDDQSPASIGISIAGDPTISQALNFNDVATFDGADDSLRTALIINAGSQPDLAIVSVYMPRIDLSGAVWSEDDAGFLDRLLIDTLTDGCNNSVTNGTDCETDIGPLFVPGFPTLASVVFDEDVAAGSFVFTDGTVRHTFDSDHTPGTSSPFRIGSTDAGFYFDGDIAEVIVYNQLLAGATDRLQIESYLALKYGMTLESDYRDSSSTVIWDIAANSSNGNDIAGLIQDDSSGLDQKVSKSSNSAAILVGATEQDFVSNNASGVRTTSLGDGNSILWGSNGENTLFDSAFDGVADRRMDRIWKIEETGTVGNIYIAIPNTITFPGNPKVVISGDTTFDNTDTIINLTDDGTHYWAQIDPVDGDFISFTSPAIPKVLINEVEYDSVQLGTDAVYEWVELYNSTTSTVDISGWTLADNDAGQEFTIPAATTIAPNSVFLLVNDTASFTANYPLIVPDIDMASALSLSNSGEPLSLRAGPVATGDLVDFVEWENTVGGWPLFAGANAGESICRISLIDTDTVADWQDCEHPTPGVFGVVVDVEVLEPQPRAVESATPSGSISLLLDGPLLVTSTIELADLGTGTATEGVGNDYTFTSSQVLTIVPGVYVNTTPTVVSVPGLVLLDDILDEGDEAIHFAIQNPSTFLFVSDTNGDSFAQSTTTYTIADDDLGGGLVRTGCLDPLATNYDQWAVKTDNSCTYATPPSTTTSTTSTSTVPTVPTAPQEDAVSVCAPLLSENMRLGRDNDPEQVKVLQNFLNKHEGTSLSVDGVFSQAVHDAVVSFQEKHSGDVLDFWNINAGTGYVFYTTRAKMNAINCAEKKPTLSCPYFEYFTDLGEASDSVKRVQIFLNENEGENLSVTGQYDQSTKDAISRYQDKYASEILSPWNISAGTGLFLQTTRKHMHRQMGCFELPVRLPNGVVVE